MNTSINIRTEKSVRDEAKKIFSKMGLSTSAGINMFLHQVIAMKGLPFTPTIDKKKLAAEWDKEAAWALAHTKGYTNAKDALADL